MVIENVGAGNLEDGIPDGMKCDEQGNVWVKGPARRLGGQSRR